MRDGGGVGPDPGVDEGGGGAGVVAFVVEGAVAFFGEDEVEGGGVDVAGGVGESERPVCGGVDDALASCGSDEREVVLAYEVGVAQEGFFPGELGSEYGQQCVGLTDGKRDPYC